MMTQSASALTRSASSALPLPPLRAVRIAKGKGLRETASAARIDPAHLSRVERGERQLSVEALYRLAQVLDLHELVKLLRPYLDAS